jgi:hypothetical protein
MPDRNFSEEIQHQAQGAFSAVEALQRVEKRNANRKLVFTCLGIVLGPTLLFMLFLTIMAGLAVQQRAESTRAATQRTGTAVVAYRAICDGIVFQDIEAQLGVPPWEAVDSINRNRTDPATGQLYSSVTPWGSYIIVNTTNHVLSFQEETDMGGILFEFARGGGSPTTMPLGVSNEIGEGFLDSPYSPTRLENVKLKPNEAVLVHVYLQDDSNNYYYGWNKEDNPKISPTATFTLSIWQIDDQVRTPYWDAYLGPFTKCPAKSYPVTIGATEWNER